MQKVPMVLFVAAALFGCASSPAYVQQRGGMANIDRTTNNWNEHLHAVAWRARQGEFQTTADIREAVRAHAEAHIADRIARNDVVGSRKAMVDNSIHRLTAR